VLLDDGVAHESTTDPVVLAYALRQENRIPTARLVTHPVEDDFDDGDLDSGDLDEDELAVSRALEIVVAELTRPPAAPADDDAAAGLPDWRNSPVQSTVLTSTANGVYDTPVEIYALHSCLDRRDYYLVNSGGDWTPTGARYESASVSSGQMRVDSEGNLTVDWQESDSYCDVGYFLDPERICRYMNYPLSYEVNIIPPSGPAVQIDTTRPRAGNYDKSTDYESGLSAVFLGPVNVSGNGPSSGIQVGDVSWNNEVSTSVPPLAMQVAGDPFDDVPFQTRYLYCTSGDHVDNCTSTIQMVSRPGDDCRADIVGQPQDGQTPDGRLSDVVQLVVWGVDPATYTTSTFDITVAFQAELATSTSKLWGGQFRNIPDDGNVGPTGYCDPLIHCFCSIRAERLLTKVSHTFKIPPPSKLCPS
jgi:hypothetical protein